MMPDKFESGEFFIQINIITKYTNMNPFRHNFILMCNFFTFQSFHNFSSSLLQVCSMLEFKRLIDDVIFSEVQELQHL